MTPPFGRSWRRRCAGSSTWSKRRPITPRGSDKIAPSTTTASCWTSCCRTAAGLKLLEELKRRGLRAGVIIISARDSLDDKIGGLELGADDYLPKPFHLAELSARIRSVLRRHRHDGRQSLDAGNVRLWPDSRRVEVAGREVELLRKEYDILHYFMSRPNHTIDKAALAEGVWGDHIDQADNFDFVYAQMKNLRRKLEKAGADIEIRAVYGFGYKLVRP